MDENHEISIIAGDCKFCGFDEQSVLHTPPPIAASTDMKNSRQHLRDIINDGSFIQHTFRNAKENEIYEISSIGEIKENGSIFCSKSHSAIKKSVVRELSIVPEDKKESQNSYLCEEASLIRDNSYSSTLLDFSPLTSNETHLLKSVANLSGHFVKKKSTCGSLNLSQEKKSRNNNYVVKKVSKTSNENVAEYTEKCMCPKNNKNSSLSGSAVFITDEPELTFNNSSDTLLWEQKSKLKSCTANGLCNEAQNSGKDNEFTDDLAYWTSFTCGKNDGTFCNTSHQDDTFIAAENAIAMLAQDELEFEKNNGIFKDDQMVPLQDCSNIDDWCAPNDLTSACVNLSIEELLQAQSSFLGTFSSDANRKRPTFGNNGLTSPPTRSPHPLIDISSLSLLNNGSEQHEDLSHEHGTLTSFVKCDNSLLITNASVNLNLNSANSAGNETNFLSIPKYISDPQNRNSNEDSSKSSDSALCENFTLKENAVEQQGNNEKQINSFTSSNTDKLKNCDSIIDVKCDLSVDDVTLIDNENEKQELFHEKNLDNLSKDDIVPIGNNINIQESFHDNNLDQSMVFFDMKVIAPKELHITEVCCIGCTSNIILPLLNETSQWLDVSIEICSVSIDDNDVDILLTNPFNVVPKIILEPQTTEACRILFTPYCEGSHVAVLRICGIPSVNCHQNVLPKILRSVLLLRANAENPIIEIESKNICNGKVLDFGIVPLGSDISATITLQNYGLANTPICLEISNTNEFESFTFCLKGNTSLEKNSQFRCALTSNQVNHDTSSLKINVSCDTSTIKMMSTSPSKEISGLLDVKVDVLNKYISIRKIILKAVVGIIRIHTPKEMHNLIELNYVCGKETSFDLPIRNAGNVAAKVNLSITDYADLFAVIPSSLILKPGVTEYVHIKVLSTLHNVKTLESNLLLEVEQTHVVYEIKLVVNNNNYKLVEKMPLASLLLADKQNIYFSGVAVGQMQHQMVCFQNGVDFSYSIVFSLEGSSDFHLLGLEHIEKDGKKPFITINPKTTYRLYVMFAPTSIKEHVGILHISVLNSTKKYSLPLFGLGGCCQITIANLTLGNTNSYWLSMGSLVSNGTSVSKIFVKNTGQRTAFINAVCYKNSKCNDILSEKQLSIQPNCFRLSPGMQQSILLVLKPDQNNVVFCEKQSSVVAVIAFYSCNEILRKRMQKYHHLQDNIGKLLVKPPIDFNVELGDNLPVENFSTPILPNEDKLFFSSINRTCVMLVGEPVFVPAKTSEIANVDCYGAKCANSIHGHVFQKNNINGQQSNVLVKTKSVSNIPEHDLPVSVQCNSFKSHLATAKPADERPTSCNPDVPKSSNKSPLVIINPSLIDFGEHEISSKKTMYIEIQNRETNDYQIFISNICSPFFIKTKKFTLKKRNYVRLPIEFRPQKKGNYSCSIFIEINMQSKSDIFLSGTAI